VPQHFSRVGHGAAQVPPLLLELLLPPLDDVLPELLELLVPLVPLEDALPLEEPVPEDPLLLPEVLLPEELVLEVPLLLDAPLLLEEVLPPAVPPVDDPVLPPPSAPAPSTDASDSATNAEPPQFALTTTSNPSAEATAKEDRMTHTLPAKV
jgi:hypothetical protein